MYKKARLLTLAAVAICMMAAAGGTASASTVTASPGGAITATFPAGGIVFTTTFVTTSCQLVLTGSLATSATGTLTSPASIDVGGISTATVTPTTCNGVTFTFLGLGTSTLWRLLVGSKTGSLYALRLANVQVQAKLGIVTCLFTGNVDTSTDGTTINPPSGTLSAGGICGNAAISGTGGTISPAQTITLS